METNLSTHSLKDVLRFPFQDPNWVNRFLVGSALMLAAYLVPIVPALFVTGYILVVMRQAAKGKPLTLPAWENWGVLILDGLKGLAISLVFLLPGLLIFGGGMGLYFAGTFAFSIAAEAGSRSAAVPMIIMMFVLIGILFLSMALGTLFFMLGAAPMPGAAAHFAAEGRFGAAFQARAWWRCIQRNPLGYLLAWLVTLGLSALLYTLFMMLYYSVVLCLLTPFVLAPASFYLALVAAALFGQAYHEGAPESVNPSGEVGLETAAVSTQ